MFQIPKTNYLYAGYLPGGGPDHIPALECRNLKIPAGEPLWRPPTWRFSHPLLLLKAGEFFFFFLCVRLALLLVVFFGQSRAFNAEFREFPFMFWSIDSLPTIRYPIREDTYCTLKYLN